MLIHLAILVPICMVIALLMGWKPLKKRVVHDATPVENKAANSYNTLIAQIVTCNDPAKLKDLRKESEGFFDYYYGKVPLVLLKDFFSQLITELKTAEQRLDENSYV